MIIDPIIAEYRRYKKLGDMTIASLDEEHLNEVVGKGNNSITVIVWHVSGNLKSRFTDFLTSDGEKPWRKRDEEFADRIESKEIVLEEWNNGWQVLFEALGSLSDADAGVEIKIRGVSLTVMEALARSSSHVAYHVGEIVQLGRIHLEEDWQSLSIPKDGSAEYNKNPTNEKA